jgi:hypothetical protein
MSRSYISSPPSASMACRGTALLYYTNTQAFSGIRNSDLRNQAAEDLRLKSRCHRDRLCFIFITLLGISPLLYDGSPITASLFRMFCSCRCFQMSSACIFLPKEKEIKVRYVCNDSQNSLLVFSSLKVKHPLYHHL